MTRAHAAAICTLVGAMLIGACLLLVRDEQGIMVVTMLPMALPLWLTAFGIGAISTLTGLVLSAAEILSRLRAAGRRR